nr:TonB-dependent receptor [Acidobacteriota bacterium]
GFFSIVTKSGGNRFSGESSGYFQGKGLESENIDDRLRTAGVTRANQLVDDRDLSLSAGGRIIRDRLWWYGSVRRQNRTFRVLGFDRDVKDKINAFFGKTTFQAGNNHRLTGQANHWTEDVNYFFFNFAPALAAGPEVSMLRKPGGDAAQGRWDGVLGTSVVAETVVGWNNFRLHQLFQPEATVNVIDLISGKRFGNPGNGSRISKEDNYDVTGSVSWFVPHLVGRHNFKAGGEYTSSLLAVEFDEIDEHQLRTQGGVPFSVIIENTPLLSKVLHRYASLYVQDAWTIAARLTVNAGVRYDHVRAITPEQGSGAGTFATTYLAAAFPQLGERRFARTDLLTWNSFAPRAAASFDINKTRRTVLKAGYARYYHHLNAQQVGGANPNSSVFITHRWNDLNGDSRYQLGEEGTVLSVFGGGTTGIDPDIRHPYSDELTFGIGHELVRDFSVNANFIYRTDDDLIYTINSGIPFDTYTRVSVADPGPDGVTGGSDDGTLTVFSQDPATFGKGRSLLTNPGRRGFENQRTYRGFEVIGNKRLSNRWQFVGSLVVSKMEVTTPTSESGGAIGAIFQTPNNLLNARGIDDLNQKYQVKLQGTYVAPYGIVLSSLYRYGSGVPFTRQLVARGLPQGPVTVFAEHRGSRKSDAYHWTDFRAEKTFALPRAKNRRKVGVTFDLFNITNASTVLQYGSRTAIDFGVPRVVRNPRIARLGARIVW